MKQFLLIACVFYIFSRCTSFNEKRENADKLSFEPVSIESKIISGTAQLEGDLKKQKLSLSIKLENNSKTDVHVEDVNLETTEGYQAKLISPEFKSFTLFAQTDTMITLQYKPINDFELYVITGESGKFKPLYNFSIVYLEDKDESLIKSQFNVLKEDFTKYEKNYLHTTSAYKFKTGTDFTEKQRKYLNTFLNVSSFVHLSDQGVAITGLNFRLQSYQKGDSLHARVFIVNHAEFPIKIDPNAFDIFNKNSSANDNRRIQFQKITGIQTEANILRKGDRAVISLSKYLKDTTGNRLSISFKNTFIIPNGKSLFYENPELVKL